VQSVEHLFEGIASSKEVFPWRKRSWDRFLEKGIPKRGQEEFQYVNLGHLPNPTKGALKELPIPSHTLLFVDGFFQGANLPTPLVSLKTSAAMLVYGIFLQNRLKSTLDEETDPFALMNGALHGEGAFLYVPPNTTLEKPIEIHHHFTTSEMSSPRIQVFLGRGASIKIVERMVGEGFFSNHYADISLDSGASLFWGASGPKSPQAQHFSAIRTLLKKESRFHFLTVTKGMKLSRNSLKVQLLEEGGEALLQGLSCLDQDLESHSHVTVEHKAPHTQSRQHFKTVLKEKSKSSFEGKIKVHSVAQKTEAYQLNNHLLLSDEAEAHAKPNLEISADDVKASHGATVSQLKEEELFYFRSRGISLPEAKEALVQGFCDEILEQVPAGVFL